MQCSEGESERDESTEEQLQCKKAVVIHSSWDTVSCFSLLCLCTESMHETTLKQIPEYAISEITNPQSYCGEKKSERLVSDDYYGFIEILCSMLTSGVLKEHGLSSFRNGNLRSKTGETCWVFVTRRTLCDEL